MIIKLFMVVILSLSSTNILADAENPDCFLKLAQLASHEDTNLCSIEKTHELRDTDSLIINDDTGKEQAVLFNNGKHKSSAAEIVTVILFIPALIILLFSGLTKSTK